MSAAERNRTNLSVYYQIIAADIKDNRKKIDLLQQDPIYRIKHRNISRRGTEEVYVDKEIRDFARIGFVNQPGQIDFELQKDAAAIAKYLFELSLEYPPSGTASENFNKFLQEQSHKPGGFSNDEELCKQLGLEYPIIHGRRIHDVSEITHVVGIGNSGLPFSRAMQPLFPGTQLIEVPKLEPGMETSIEDKRRIIKAKSYSKKVVSDFDFPLDQVPEGSNVFLADDVCAKGLVSLQFAQYLLRHNINVAGLGVYFDKVHQGGIELFEALCGVPAVSVLNITSIDSQNGTINIAPFRKRSFEDSKDLMKTRVDTRGTVKYSVGDRHPSTLRPLAIYEKRT